MNDNEEWIDEDGEILGSFLIEDEDDIDVIVMPKLNFDLEKELDEWYKRIKRCRNKEQIKDVLRQFFDYATGIATLQLDIQYLQDRAKEIELNIKMLEREFR